MLKTCSRCKIEKDILEFRFRKDKNYYVSQCKQCESEQSNQYNKEHKQEVGDRRATYYQNNKVDEQEYHKNYRVENQKKFQAKNRNYYLENREEIIARTYENKKKRLLTDIEFKLRNNVSSYIRIAINKNYQSITKYLPYNIEELKGHIEKQFEPWMTWENWGKYDPITWNDKDQTTWKWQIDHIVPHSTFKYSSMQDDSFQQCWALSNLRPLSAKQNLLDGTSRTRH